MGIRFLCPNGHRLNVKAFLAGKRGYCPHCGVKLLIPLESDLRPAPQSEGEPDPGASIKLKTVPQVGVAQENLSRFATTSDSPTVDPGDRAEATSNGDAQWFVRPPSGGQFGPATGAVMRRWVDEGRVPPDSLVWREGWLAWQPADSVAEFAPQANDDSESDRGESTLLDSGARLPALSDGDDPLAATHSRRRRRRAKNVRAIAVILLVLTCVLLLGVLLVIVSRSGS